MAFWIHTVLMFALFGSSGYALADFVSDISTWICIARGGDKFFFERWWWTWTRYITAGSTGVGGTTHVVYRVAGSWEQAKQNFLTECERVPQKKQIEEEVPMAAQAVYSCSFLYARAAVDCALWVKEMSEQGKIDPYIPPPLWHSLGPFAVVATIALSRSNWGRGKTGQLRTRVGPAEDEKTASEKGGSIA